MTDQPERNTPPKRTRPDDSVQFALAELEALESERLQEEARAALAREEAAETARRRERARAEREAAVAREAARLNVDAEVEARTADGDRRLATMRAELERIRTERELIHRRMLAGDVEATARPSARHWPMIAGLLGATASVLGVLLFVQATAPTPEPEVIIREVHVPFVAPAEPEPAAAPTPETTEAAVAEAVAEPAVQRPARPRPRPQRPDTHEQALDRMNDCGDDPLCGLD